ncbi:AbiH family protein [Lacticaseibacillus zhaodongensis]|uniref:AbiH family protein n=1 Tax=Lacticaseibacillus zhaodongensis TaxID=2668065 RepID=UPI0018AF5931|nr:AbiH family protein [Lacticaseibacillus zhaodongensis]
MRDMTSFRYRPVTSKLNITMLVGNGFDIRMLKYFGRSDTSFAAFYQFERASHPDKIRHNHVLQRMHNGSDSAEHAPDTQNQEWSDIEAAILKCMRVITQNKRLDKNGKQIALVKLIQDVDEVRADFSDYIRDVVTPIILRSINKHANRRPNGESDFTLDDFEQQFKAGLQIPDLSSSNLNTLRSFSADLKEFATPDFQRLNFDDVANQHDILDIDVFNFNYTTILDNYLALSKGNFDPHVNSESSANFGYFPNGNNTEYYDYLLYSVEHPHGISSIPSSMMFGIDDIDFANADENSNHINADRRYNGVYGVEQLLSKPYLVQDEINYRSRLQDTELFIAFGLSFGDSDYWWWKNILLRMSQWIPLSSLQPLYGDSKHRADKKTALLYQPELIIYSYSENLNHCTNKLAFREIESLQRAYCRLEKELEHEQSDWTKRRSANTKSNKHMPKDPVNADLVDRRLGQPKFSKLIPFQDIVERIYVIPFNDRTLLHCFGFLQDPYEP